MSSSDPQGAKNSDSASPPRHNSPPQRNLTREHKLVLYVTGFDPVPGHHVVLFKKVGQGQIFHSCLAPGQKLKGFFFRSHASFVAYAVPEDQNLRYQFVRDYKSHDQVHDFTLCYTVEFCVADPRILVEMHERDPLRRVEAEVDSLLVQTLQDLDWQPIEKGKSILENILFGHPAAGGTNLEKLQRFAAGVGLDVRRVVVDRRLPPKEIRVSVTATEAQREEQIKRIEAQRDQQIKLAQHGTNKLDQTLSIDLASQTNSFERYNLIADATVESAGSAIKSEMGKAHSIAGIGDSLREVQALLGGSGATFVPAMQPAMPAGMPGAAPAQLLAAGVPAPGSSLANLLLEVAKVAMHLEALGCEPGERRRVMAHTLHVIAEAVLNGAADDAVMRHHADELSHLFAGLLGKVKLDPDQARLLQRIGDIESLKRELA